ncbi:LysR substrate-binding domain-containing protein [Nocardia sp. CA-135953]|uniref:LysR substrate-binding domain-containing protein n=1 Tax=Nocardia sp. CA-135953 TaxID=3239978 RepID=UPI003D987FA5
MQSDQAFAGAGLDRDVAFEVTSADYVARLVGPGLAVAMFPAACAPQLTGVVTIEVVGRRGVEYVIRSRAGRTPAATAFLAVLGIPAHTAD